MSETKRFVLTVKGSHTNGEHTSIFRDSELQLSVLKENKQVIMSISGPLGMYQVNLDSTDLRVLEGVFKNET